MVIDMTGAMELIDSAHADRVDCLLGTASAESAPQISPKGSMMVFDGARLAYWERSGRTALENLGVNPRVVVYYRNSAKTEQEKDPDKKGAAVIIAVERITDLGGNVIQD